MSLVGGKFAEVSTGFVSLGRKVRLKGLCRKEFERSKSVHNPYIGMLAAWRY